MKIINVVELLGGVLSSIESFPIAEGYFSEEEAVAEAEELFCKKAHEAGMSVRDASHHIENGNYDDQNGYEVLIHWSGINVKE